MEAEERVFAEQLQKGLSVPEPTETLQHRLRMLATSAETPPPQVFRRLSLVLAPALALACVVYVRAQNAPLPPPVPVATSPDPKASPDPKDLITPGVESIPEPGTLCLLLPGLLVLRRKDFWVRRRN